MTAQRSTVGERACVRPWPAAVMFALTAVFSVPSAALALSEIQREELLPPADATPRGGATDPPGDPLPEPLESPLPDRILVPGEDAPGTMEAPGDIRPDVTRPDIATDEPVPEIIYDVSRLPEPVARMRQLIIEACRSGDIERLRPLLGTGDNVTQLSFGGPESDPIGFLREVSGDDEGQEILAILLEVMEAGYVHLDAGEPYELYVWPYFFAVPLDRLDARQRVELFTLVTAGDYKEMKSFGAYIFYRVGITPEGEWTFFVAGD